MEVCVLSLLALFLCPLAAGAGESLLRNPGCEELNADGTLPLYWSMNPAYPGEIEVADDALRSQRGSRAVVLSREDGDVALCQGPFPIVARRQVTVSA